jgi:hypothetical protein
VNLMAVNTALVGSAVITRLPIDQVVGMAITAPIWGNRYNHVLVRMTGAEGTVTGLARNPGQQKTTGVSIITGRVAGKTVSRFVSLLHIYLKDGIYDSLGVVTL